MQRKEKLKRGATFFIVEAVIFVLSKAVPVLTPLCFGVAFLFGLLFMARARHWS